VTRAFLVCAAVIGVLYGLAQLAGLREDTAILSGTSPPGGAAGAALGVGYLALHFAWVVGAPVLVLAAGIYWALWKYVGTRPGG
jgi:hypothetical protein